MVLVIVGSLLVMGIWIILIIGCEKCCDRGVYKRLLRVEVVIILFRRSGYFISSDFLVGI